MVGGPPELIRLTNLLQTFHKLAFRTAHVSMIAIASFCLWAGNKPGRIQADLKLRGAKHEIQKDSSVGSLVRPN